MIAAIHMGGVLGLVLTSQQHSRLSRNPAKGLTGGINDIPFAVDLTSFSHVSGHHKYLLFLVLF